MTKQLTVRVSDDLDERLRAQFWTTRADHRLSFNAWLVQLLSSALSGTDPSHTA